MYTYSALNDEEKALLAELEKQTRAWLNGLARLLAQGRALDAAWEASNGGKAVLNSLNAGEVVPNSSNIKGAQHMTKEEWETMLSAGLEDFLTKYDTDAVRRVLAKASGPTAGL